MTHRPLPLNLLILTFATTLAACGGGGSTESSPSSSAAQSSSVGQSSSQSSAQSSSSMSSTSSSSSANSSSSGSSTTSSSSSSASSSSTSSAASLAAQLVAKLGKPNRLLVGLGGMGSTISNINAQALKPDIRDIYLTGVGAGAWPNYNTPSGDYVRLQAIAADNIGAVPMFTLYQMAANGDSNLSGINNSTFMTQYWAQVKLMFQKIAAFNKPVLVNFEPDFWGYVQLQAPGGNPASMAAQVNINSDCTTYANNVVGIAGCLVHMARVYAPKALVGFPPSSWGSYGNPTAVMTFMNLLGANQADFIVAQTSDRDAGCFELVPQPSNCVRNGTGWYMSDQQYTAYFNMIDIWHTGIGNLPVIWWQTPLGTPSSTAGGTVKHYRDNHVQYFLTHPQALINVGGAGVVFGEGDGLQTDITTDGGQFKTLSTAYFANPAAL